MNYTVDFLVLVCAPVASSMANYGGFLILFIHDGLRPRGYLLTDVMILVQIHSLYIDSNLTVHVACLVHDQLDYPGVQQFAHT